MKHLNVNEIEIFFNTKGINVRDHHIEDSSYDSSSLYPEEEKTYLIS